MEHRSIRVTVIIGYRNKSESYGMVTPSGNKGESEKYQRKTEGKAKGPWEGMLIILYIEIPESNSLEEVPYYPGMS